MKRAITIVGCVFGIQSLMGCGTLTGAVAGPLLGGTSMTVRVYKTETSVPVKVLSTPFVFIGGTAFGIFPGLWRGAQYDLQMVYDHTDSDRFGRAEVRMSDILDPFTSELWEVTPYSQTHGRTRP